MAVAPIHDDDSDEAAVPLRKQSRDIAPVCFHFSDALKLMLESTIDKVRQSRELIRRTDETLRRWEPITGKAVHSSLCEGRAHAPVKGLQNPGGHGVAGSSMRLLELTGESTQLQTAGQGACEQSRTFLD